MMKIAVLSGKGGTGKTFVSVNLASIQDRATYIDCDVEEPNGHLFFKPQQIKQESVTVQIPVVDSSKCTGCRACVDFCEYHALTYLLGQIKLFPDICHSCGGCKLICPTQAITEIPRAIGRVETGISEGIEVMTGILNTGEASGIPIIKKMLSQVDDQKPYMKSKTERVTVIDCPPGSACIVMESIKEADYCVLVAEPTIFGRHNLEMVHQLVTLFNKPYGAVLNKCTDDENPSEVYCIEHSIPLLGRIPFDELIGTQNSNGEILVRTNAFYAKEFEQILHKIELSASMAQRTKGVE